MADPDTRPLPLRPGSVMLWDPRTQSFSPKTPDSHSSNTAQGAQPTNPVQRPRRPSIPESVISLDFGEFLKQLDRARQPSPTLSTARASTVFDPYRTEVPHSVIESPAVELSPAPQTSKPAKKRVFKTALKEVLGGGGNNKNEPIPPKDAYVLPFGRGGVARTPSKTKPAEKLDPYFAHVPLGSPTSPVDLQFPPNANIPRRKSHTQERDPYEINSPSSEYHVHSPSDHFFVNQAPQRSPGQRHAIYDVSSRWDYGVQRPPSPAQSTSTASTASDSDHSDDSTVRRPATPPLGTLSSSTAHRIGPRHRATSFGSSLRTEGSLVSFRPVASGHGVFLHPEQAAWEVQGELDERRDLSYIAEDEKMYATNARDVGVDVISVSASEIDDDVSLRDFPQAPSSLPPDLARRSDRKWSLPSYTHSYSEDYPSPSYQHPRSAVLKPSKQLPTMPGPSSHTAGAGRTPSSHSTDTLRLPPAPSTPAPLPRLAVQPPRVVTQPPASTSSESPRRSSAPGAPSPSHDLSSREPDNNTRQQQEQLLPPPPPVLPMTPMTTVTSFETGSVFSAMHSTTSLLSTHAELQEELELEREADALAREREMLEERVRGLMWLVSNMEDQQALQEYHHRLDAGSPVALVPIESEPEAIRSTGGWTQKPEAMPPREELDGRSSTSTERAVSYLPYTR